MQFYLIKDQLGEFKEIYLEHKKYFIYAFFILIGALIFYKFQGRIIQLPFVSTLVEGYTNLILNSSFYLLSLFGKTVDVVVIKKNLFIVYSDTFRILHPLELLIFPILFFPIKMKDKIILFLIGFLYMLFFCIIRTAILTGLFLSDHSALMVMQIFFKIVFNISIIILLYILFSKSVTLKKYIEDKFILSQKQFKGLFWKVGILKIFLVILFFDKINKMVAYSIMYFSKFNLKLLGYVSTVNEKLFLHSSSPNLPKVYITDNLIPHQVTVYLDPSCLGINLTGVFALFILLTRSKIAPKVWFITLGCLFIYYINSIRVTILFVVYSQKISLLMGINPHTLFNYMVYIFIFFMWVFWINIFVIFPSSNTQTK